MRESDLESRNSFVKAYIRPEYSWAASRNYNQSNIPFVLNVQDGTTENQIEPYRGSKNDETSDFWVAYILLGYQPAEDKDNDPYTESPTYGVTMSGVVGDDPPTRIPGRIPAPFPEGGHGSILYLETCRDDDEFFDPRLYVTLTSIDTSIHELGHQFGLKGDTSGNIHGVMSYGRESYSFVEQHINFMRHRVESPGEYD